MEPESFLTRFVDLNFWNKRDGASPQALARQIREHIAAMITTAASDSSVQKGILCINPPLSAL
jgi:hypothetical protein